MGPIQYSWTKVWLYFPNASKTWLKLVTKENSFSAAQAVFADTNIQVTSEGRPYLGIPVGTDEYIQSFIARKIGQWAGELEKLAQIACSQPHAAYAAFTHGFTSKWTYFTRTMKDLSSFLVPLELIIRSKLIPALTCRPPPSDLERNLLALPARLGGMAIPDPSAASNAYISSLKITQPIVNTILTHNFRYSE